MSENFAHCLRGLAGVSLHDCHVTRIGRRGGSVELTLPRGVWLLPGCPDNPGETICKTPRGDSAPPGGGAAARVGGSPDEAPRKAAAQIGPSPAGKPRRA